MTRQEKKEELIGLFCTGAIFIGDLIDECFDFGQQHPHWISVEDELPPTSDKDDESDDYLIVDRYGDKNVGYYNKMDKLWFACDGNILYVTHWMPLPAAPKKGGEE